MGQEANVQENTPLLSPSNASGDKSSNFYFLRSTSENPGHERQNTLVESVPAGATEDEFAPRVLSREPPPPTSPYAISRKTNRPAASTNGPPATSSSSNQNILSSMFGGFFRKTPSPVVTSTRQYGDAGTLVKLRKAPIKIEPKVFFANERTFLAWMHLSIILAGASIAILAFADESDNGNPLGQLYGVVLLPVAISFIIYSMYQYQRRATMIRHRHPGPYEDTVGPVVLGVMLMISIVAQFALKMYAMASP